jgi:phosphoenolpyruvate carboxykinase (ATP)
MVNPSAVRDEPRPGATVDLSAHGLRHAGTVYANVCPAALVELAVRRGEGVLAANGAFTAVTGSRTGRSPRDRFIVAEPSSEKELWWGPVNRPLAADAFERLHHRVLAYLQGRDLFVCDAAACADPRYRLPVRVIADKAWHALFARCLLRDPARDTPSAGRGVSAGGLPLSDSAHGVPAPPPGLAILCASDMRAEPAIDGTRTEAFIVLHLAQRVILVGGTGYAGEIKKSVFSFLNYLLPHQGVFPMHCSANTGPDGATALFFGLSGTGKTTLSADIDRRLIGDDEHGWSDAGVFNIEGGCYAKTIRLSREGEPQIWNALRFGAVLENVVLDPATRVPDYDDDRLTENTRAAYPLDHIDGVEPSSRGGHPRTILFLSCDAFGVLPPLARLSPEQALYYFLSGYTAKVAGTEAGVTEPEATFSTCFGAPFLPLPPARYAELLHTKLREHHSDVWLVNTGWTGGPYGVGRRMPLTQTRALVRAALDGSLARAEFRPDSVFKVQVPLACPGVDARLLRPRDTWSDGAAYDAKARHLAGLFQNNFQAYADSVPEAVRQAGPRKE